MTTAEHNKILAIGFGVFATITAFTFLLLMLISFGVFVALGISLANEPANGNQAGIGIAGGVFAIVFYLTLGAIFVLPIAVAAWKLIKRRLNARIWGIIAAILVIPIIPLGTTFGIYGLWFFCSVNGRQFYMNESGTGTLESMQNRISLRAS